MAVKQRKNVAYSLNQPFSNIFPEPIVSKRAPTNRDMAHVGTLWINEPANQGFVLTSIVANVATWVEVTQAGAGGGTFTDVTVTTGDVTLENGNIVFQNANSYIEFSNDIRIFGGNGSPDGVLNAEQGSLFLRTDGTGVNDRMYINTDGADTWTAVVTVA